MHFHGTAKVNEHGHLEIGQVDTVTLAQKYGTPLYVYDVALIRERARVFKQTFERLGVEAQVAYASKAFSSIAMFQLANEEGLSLDVVSAGELFTAIKAGFPRERIHLHGNNKSVDELQMALDEGVGCIVVDNFHEIRLLERLCREGGKGCAVLLRVTPGIEAHTHDYILTGQEDSKFGFDLWNGQAEEALRIVLANPDLHLLGLHCHIGSQIFEPTGFILAAKKIGEQIANWYEKYSYAPEVLNLGGGFGIRYTNQDSPLPVAVYIEEIVNEVKVDFAKSGLPMPEIWIEPGRSLVGDAGTTIYEIGSTKQVPDIRTYWAVDGGMSDNIRPSLYQAKYEAVLANRVMDPVMDEVAIAGKCCESGDMLIWDVPLPHVQTGDYLAVFCTGAYGYSMASNYNRLRRPAVVFVEEGKDRLVIRRESLEDLVRNDMPLDV